MAGYRFTEYFQNEVLRKRPYLKKGASVWWSGPFVLSSRKTIEYRFWAEIPELEGHYLRVITLEDKVTIHNAFPDRQFKP